MRIKRQRTKKIANSKGFSFIEAMLAVAIMVTGIIAAMDLFASGIKQSLESRDQTIGAMLAQEGAEVVQNIRDNNWAARTTRLAFDNLPSDFSVTDDCRVSYSSTNMLDCSPSDKRLYLAAANPNYYDLDSSGTPTKFKRKIIIKYYDVLENLVVSSSARKAEVTSVVIWGNASFPDGTDVSSANCSTASNCAYSKTILSKWAE